MCAGVCGHPRCRHPTSRHVAARAPGAQWDDVGEDVTLAFAVECLDCEPRKLTALVPSPRRGLYFYTRICPMGSLRQLRDRLDEIREGPRIPSTCAHT